MASLKNLVISEQFRSLFLPAELMGDIIESRKLTLLPTVAVSDNRDSYVFELPYITSEFIDLNSFSHYIRGRLVKADGSGIGTTDIPLICNNFCHSLFENIQFEIGENQLSIYENYYSYKSYLKSILTIGYYSAKRDFTLLDPDTCKTNAGKNPTYNDISPSARMLKYSGSKIIELQDKINAGWLSSNGYLFPKVPIRITYKLNIPRFYIFSKGGAAYKFQILDFKLSVQAVTLSDMVKAYCLHQIQKIPATLRFKNMDLKIYNIDRGISFYSKQKIISGKVPRHVILAFTPAENFLGSFKKKAMYFPNLNMTSLNLKLNERSIFSIKANFKNNEGVLDVYKRFLNHKSSDISRFFTSTDHFIDMSCFYVCDLLDGCDEGTRCGLNLLPSGDLNIEISFSEALGEEYIMLVYSIQTNAISINSLGNVEMI